MTAEPLPWTCEVTEVSPHHWRTTFRVGVQSFTLADTYDGDEGKQHCELIRNRFVEALQRAGFLS